MLNAIKQQPVEGIKDLVHRARQRDDLWREPFLLAVAYQSTVDEKVASDIIRELLSSPPGTSREKREHDLLLAAESLVESKPLTLDSTLEKQIANQLLQSYEEAQRRQRFKVCSAIENAMRRWLLSLSREAYRPPLLAVLYETILDTSHIARQRAALTLLAMIVYQLAACSPNVFETLIPLLLALAGLPAVGEYRPSPAIPASSDLNVADLALTALSFLGKQGPAGVLLASIRQHFKKNPHHLRLLARYSIESGTLLTLAVVPLIEENYQSYEGAVEQWIKLRDAHKTGHVSEREIDTSLNIHQALLECAEEVCYPTASHLLAMLQLSAQHPDQPWQPIWQGYLLRQLAAGRYIDYQQSILLYVTLFPEAQVQVPLASLLLLHYNSDGTPLQRNAQRILATFAIDLRNLRDLRYVRNIRNLGFLRNIRNLEYLGELRETGFLRNLRDMGYPGNLGNLAYRQNLRYLRNLQDTLFTQVIAREIINRLSSVSLITANVTEQIDLLTILMGRELHIVEDLEEVSDDVERETRQIVQVVHVVFTATNNDEVREAALSTNRLLTRNVNQ